MLQTMRYLIPNINSELSREQLLQHEMCLQLCYGRCVDGKSNTFRPAVVVQAEKQRSGGLDNFCVCMKIADIFVFRDRSA